jgi:DNA-binding IclR family transcriptional regulator
MSNSADPAGAGGPIQSVDRAATILEILARDGEAGVTDVARELGVHKSTASRLLAALARRELVSQDSARGKFRLGLGLVRLAGAAAVRLDLVQQSRPVCQALAREVGETVNIAVLSGGDALYLDQVAGPAALSPHNWAGQRIPLHATSDGKVLLAYLTESELAGWLTTRPRRFTEHTITEPGELRRVLEQVRERGYAITVEELEAGLTAVAAPVRNARGDVVASVSASGPSFRIQADHIPVIAGSVRRAAAEISRRLGWSHHVSTVGELRLLGIELPMLKAAGALPHPPPGPRHVEQEPEAQHYGQQDEHPQAAERHQGQHRDHQGQRGGHHAQPELPHLPHDPPVFGRRDLAGVPHATAAGAAPAGAVRNVTDVAAVAADGDQGTVHEGIVGIPGHK